MSNVDDALDRNAGMLRAILSDYQDVISGPDVQRGMDAVDGLRAELSRLREAQVTPEHAKLALHQATKLEAAEAEVTRLTAELQSTRKGLRDEAEAEDYLAERARSFADYEGAAIHSHSSYVLRALLAAFSRPPGDTEPCTNCDGLGHNTSWPHTTCPVCGGSGDTEKAT